MNIFMNIGKFCPLPLSNLIGNFRIYLYIVSLVVILSNWVCDNWVYRFPKFALKIFFSCSLGGGGRYFSVPCTWRSQDTELRWPNSRESRESANRFAFGDPETTRANRAI